jgi:hypothetical protein
MWIEVAERHIGEKLKQVICFFVGLSQLHSRMIEPFVID